jgi:hypothetical protein
MESRVVAGASRLSWVVACACLVGLGCGKSRDLDELGVQGHDGGVWYLDDDESSAGSARGDAGPINSGTGTGTGSGSGTSGRGGASGGAAGSGSSDGGSGGTSGGRGGSGGSTAVPLPSGGSSGFPFPGANGGSGGGFQFPGAGGQGAMMPPPPPSEDVSSCSPCESLNRSLGGVPACCTDDNQCGADLSALGSRSGCVARDQPGTMTSQCPEVSIMQGGFQIPGCCLPSGRCGIIIMRLAPLGCIEPSVVEDLLQFDMGTGRPQRCTP